jgi:predicted MFS family arabinose efflux permease
VLFINLPVVALSLLASFRLLPSERKPGQLGEFDLQGALLATGGVLLLVFALVRAPIVGWGSTQTILEFAGAAVVLVAFALNERRARNPLFPFSILRVKGLVAANITQTVSFAGFFAMWFFVTLYMQQVLHYSPIKAGIAYLPMTAAFVVSAGIATPLIARIGTRPVIVAGALIGAGGIYLVSQVPVHGTYTSHLLPGLIVMPFGASAVFVGVTIAANADVPAGLAGLAAALLTASRQLGSALGLAIFSAVATSRTQHLIATRTPTAAALTAGYQRALLLASIFVLASAVIALRSSGARETAPSPQTAPPPPFSPTGAASQSTLTAGDYGQCHLRNSTP